MSDDTTGGTGTSKGNLKLLPREIGKVPQLEIDAVMLIPIPPHPDTVFDDDEFRTLLANAWSLTIVEKVQIIVASAKFSQEQADSIIRILRGERKEFEHLNWRHTQRLRDLERQHAEERKQRESQPQDTKPTTSELTPGEKAGIVYKAIPKLLTAIGSGDGLKFFTAFLQRVTWQIEQGATGVIEGDLPAIFETELRNPELNKAASDRASDMNFINKLVRPALSKLRRNADPPVVLHKGSMFAIALIIEGPEQPRGRVKQRHRIGVFVRIDSAETARATRKDLFLRQVVKQLAERGQELIKLERLGPFGPMVRRVVEKTGYVDEESRAVFTFFVTSAILGNILDALRNDQRLPFLMHLLELPIRWNGSIPTSDFDNWFLNAIEFNDGLETVDENFDYGVGRFQNRLRYSSFPFPTQVLLLKAYHLAPGGQRMALIAQMTSLDEGRVPGGAEADSIYRPSGTVDLQGMLATNLSDVADFIRIVEARAVDEFAKE